MKKIIHKIIDILNKPTDKVNPIVFLTISIIVLLWCKNADAKYVIIFGVIGAVIMIIYTVISIVKHEDTTKTIIYLLGVVIWICAIFMYYFKLKTINYNIIGIIAPIVLMILMVTLYIRIKKIGNREKIKQAKIILIYEMILMTIVLIFFTYVLFCK